MPDIRLPIVKNPPYKSFQEPAFYLGILLVNPTYINELYNSYINLQITKNGWLDMCHPKYNWYTYDNCDCDIESIVIKTTPDIISQCDPYQHLVNLMRRKIEEGYFVNGFCDEYYISQKTNYHREHNYHDYLLYGYNDDKKYFISLGYTNQWKYEEYHIPYSEMYQSLVWREESGLKENIYGIGKYEFIKPKSEKEYDLNIGRIKEELHEFLYSKRIAYDAWLYGIKAYQYFYDLIPEIFDIRCLRLLMEHKQIMFERMKYISTKCGIDLNSIIEKYAQIIKLSEIIFNYALKYKLTEKEEIKMHVKELIKIMMSEEIPILKKFSDSI